MSVLNFIDILIVSPLIVAVVFIILNIWQNYSNLADFVEKNKDWSFKDWVNPLTSIAAGLGLVLTLAQNNPTNTGISSITGVSLICAAAIIILPTFYSIFCEPKGRVWAFLIFATLTLVIVVIDLSFAAWLADDETIRNVPAWMIHVFRGLMVLAADIAPIYYWKSTSQIIKDQAKPSDQQKTVHHINSSIKYWLIAPLSTLKINVWPLNRWATRKS